MKECVVHYHPDAVVSFEAIRDRSERRAILTVVDKLSRIGDKITMPHARYISGRRGLWELRPKGGQSRHRPLYAKVGEIGFVIFTIVPEADVNPGGFTRAVARAADVARSEYGVEL